MRRRVFNSKGLVCWLIFTFILLLFTEVLPGKVVISNEKGSKPVVRVKRAGRTTTAAQRERFESLLEEGKRLYNEMDYSPAIQKLTEARGLAATREQKSDVYFYLSLAFYATLEERGNQEFIATVMRLIEVDYYRELDEDVCPSGYIELYQEIKGEYGVLKVRSKPAGADVYINRSRTSAGKTPLTTGARAGVVMIEVRKGKKKKEGKLEVRAGEETISPEYKLKGKSSLLYILGGAAVAGGVAVALLAGGGGANGQVQQTGQIQVNSSPTGAAIYLNGNNTGQVTNALLTDISQGSHQIKLVLENYVDREETVTVTAGQTAVVDVTFNKHTIKVTDPTINSIWAKGKEMKISWEVNGSLMNQGYKRVNPASKSVSNLGRNITSFKQRQGLLFRSRSNVLGAKGRMSEKTGSSSNSEITIARSAGFVSVSVPESSKIIEGESDHFLRFPRLHRSGGKRITERDNKGNIVSLIKGSRNSGLNGLEEPLLYKSFSPVQSRQKAELKGKIRPLVLSNVKIELYKGSDFVNTIAEDTENLGFFNWEVDTFLLHGKDYKIRVSSASDASIYGESSVFEITLQSYAYMMEWGGTGTGNGKLDRPCGVAFDSAGYVYVSEWGNCRIQKFDSNGNYITQWGSKGKEFDQFYNPYHITLDYLGYIYVADTNSHRIVKCDPDGNFLAQWGGTQGSGPTELSRPTGIAVDRNLNIYIADIDNDRIVKYDSNGNYIDQWGSESKGEYEFYGPVAIAIDSQDNIYVVDLGNYRIVKYDANFNYLLEWGSEGSGDDQFLIPRGIGIDSQDNVFISDSENHRIKKFDANGNLLAIWGSEGFGNNKFDTPIGIAVDSSGYVYIADRGNDRIMKFRPDW